MTVAITGARILLDDGFAEGMALRVKGDRIAGVVPVDVALTADRRHRRQLLGDTVPQRLHRGEVGPVVVGFRVEPAAEHGPDGHRILIAGTRDTVGDRPRPPGSPTRFVPAPTPNEPRSI